MPNKATLVTGVCSALLVILYTLVGNAKPVLEIFLDPPRPSNFPKEYQKIPGLTVYSQDIVKFFQKLPVQNYRNLDVHASNISNDDIFFKNRLLKSEIMSSKTFINTQRNSNQLLYKSNISSLGDLGQKLEAIESPNPQDYTFWPVGQRASGFGPINGGDGIFLVSSKCNFEILTASSDTTNFMSNGNLKLVVQYKINDSFSSMSNNPLNIWANYLESETNKSFEMSSYNPFVFVDITRIFVFEGNTGNPITEASC